MLLEQAVEIIEYTDSDTLAQAMDVFNETGIVSGAKFPFLNTVFDNAPVELSERLGVVGFKGCINLAEVITRQDVRGYVIFDSERFSLAEAVKWGQNND
ncbi:hypothetical protein ACQKPX_14680 [Photobacterium sp. DNB23_23_1]|uniref:Uncharacterized protein n=1 Tax=Photobacterium pectinilyticum TaxID=2906793 RepID=A0ABT1N6F2_9GAMM|nr:hypothetical protein [Photobacterium sp. ZSDE20]MCQ1060328.1 hypothetical protein [Photobacterium sp. ZSDE20]MDD1828147.1 hypothetical protein [Photobacterium sp. ZSDE20]